MGRSFQPSAASPASYHGEVWTDGSGYATVRLPAEAGLLEPPLDYELRDLEPPSSARITAELEDGRFTIATDQPHVKVAWRVTGHQLCRQQQEEEE
ncbi:MAG TPA: hypothetical protein VFU30_00890 [Gaiellaceae bacterium]|nr:hypothetical protein [Gaiellaceae bacterium]